MMADHATASGRVTVISPVKTGMTSQGLRLTSCGWRGNEWGKAWAAAYRLKNGDLG